MHTCWHVGGVGIPCHQIVHRPTISQHVFIDYARPYKLVGAQHLKCATHLTGIEIACDSHVSFEKRQLALAYE